MTTAMNTGRERLSAMEIGTQRRGTISVVIPALNEEEGIAATIVAIPRTELENMGYEVQILVVDNGSEDRTGEFARKEGAEVVFEPRRGYGRAYKTGFSHARGEVIATADADLSYPVEDIPKLVKLLEDENLQFITTNRFTFMRNGAMSFEHKLGNSALNLFARILFRMNMGDSQSGMWVFRKELLYEMALKSNSMAFSQELKIEACHFIGCRWKEVPIHYRHRIGQVKLRTWRDGTNNLLRLAEKRIRRGNGISSHTSINCGLASDTNAYMDRISLQ